MARLISQGTFIHKVNKGSGLPGYLSCWEMTDNHRFSLAGKEKFDLGVTYVGMLPCGFGALEELLVNAINIGERRNT